jgi:DNA repair protein RadC
VQLKKVTAWLGGLDGEPIMEFEKNEEPGTGPACIETAFNPVQFDLPGVASDAPACVEWQVPCKVLADYLRAMDVRQPGKAARDLLDEFGSLSGLLAASRWRLRWLAGRRLANIIDASRTLMKARLLEEVEEGPIVPRSRALVDMLQIEVGFLAHERLLALYVDSGRRLIQIRHIAEGRWDQVPIDARKIIQYGLEVGASGFILVHNHPSGIPRPSTDDLASTSSLRRLAAELDLHLLDHLIIARGRFGSIEDYWREAQWKG